MPDSSNSAAADAAAASEAPKQETSAPVSPYTRVDLGDVTPHNLRLLKKVNSAVFPVVYHDKFYKDVLEAGELAKLAYYNDIVVGAVCCRVDVTSQPGKRKLYIMTLGCLAPYRRLGVGATMLAHVMDVVERDGNFDSVFLHVQANNESALSFYRRQGFEIVDTKEEYYKRIQPAHAHVLEKKVSRKGEAATAAAAAGGSGGNVNGEARRED